jgi:hypothetical protein
VEWVEVKSQMRLGGTGRSGRLAAESTKRTFHPVTGSGAAQSLRPISALEA